MSLPVLCHTAVNYVLKDAKCVPRGYDGLWVEVPAAREDFLCKLGVGTKK